MEGFPAYRKTPRLYKPAVVTEKIDGTNALVAIKDLSGEDDLEVYPWSPGEWLVFREGVPYSVRSGSRKRWLTPEQDNYNFAKWVLGHAVELTRLGPGLHYGEWWGHGIQRGYGLPKGERRFSLFNVGRWRDNHGTNAHNSADKDVAPDCCYVVPLIHSGCFGSELVDHALRSLLREGSFAAPRYRNPEGVVVYHEASRQVFKAFPEDLSEEWYQYGRDEEPEMVDA